MAARPQAVGYGTADSPAGLAAWMLVHPGFAKWNYGADPARSPSRDDVLDDITLYWLTNTGISAARLYWENGGRGATSSAAWKPTEIKVPVAVTVFGEDPFLPPETWARRAYPSLIYFHTNREGRPLRGVGAAGAVRGSDAGGVPVTSFEPTRRTALGGT